MVDFSAKHYMIKSEKNAAQSKADADRAKGYADSINPDTFLNKEMITNCITEIPQDIKLELNNGVLTLKAGSKVYVPNGKNADGSLKFDYVTSIADFTYTPNWGAGYKCLVTGYINKNGTVRGIGMCRSDLQYSGATAPNATIGGTVWYDTSANMIKTYRDGSWNTNESRALFLGVVTIGTGNVVTSIDQVFNGFGYIGSTIFVLPGVKGLSPIGRNADGTLKNEERVWTKVQTTSTTSSSSFLLHLKSNAGARFASQAAHYVQDAKPTISVTYATWYSPSENKFRFTNDTGATWLDGDGYIHCITLKTNAGVPESFNPKFPFRAISESDLNLNTISRNMIPNWSTAGTKYAAGTALPSDGFVYVIAIQSNTYVNGHQIGIMTTSGGSGWTSPNANTSFYARKGDVITGTEYYFKPLGEA